VKETREKTPPRKDECIMHLSNKTYKKDLVLRQSKGKKRKGTKI
jgi:hypothetical protein